MNRVAIFIRTVNELIYKFTNYFENDVLRRRPYLTKTMCIDVIETPDDSEEQEDGRFRFWARVPELGGQYLRVVTESDMVTIHNAMIDRNFDPGKWR